MSQCTYGEQPGQGQSQSQSQSHKGPLGWFVNGYDHDYDFKTKTKTIGPQPSISTGVGIKKTGYPSSMATWYSGDGQAVNELRPRPRSRGSLSPPNPTFIKANVESLEDLSLESEELKLKPEAESDIEDRFDVERRAWDYYGFAWTRILEQINQEKYQRKYEMRVIERRKQKLVEWKAKLDEKTKQLESREVRIIEAEPFLAVAKQLQNLGMDMEVTKHWIETINEVAHMQKITIKQATISVAQDLRYYQNLGGIERQIQKANQELELINMATIQKRQALKVVEDLLNKGVAESQIIQLINFAGEWDQYWKCLANSNLQQPGSSNPGPGSNNTGIPSNTSVSNFSMNDWIRLNLLKSNTTNMLNKISG
jgi:hypothetical protein